MHAAIGVPPYLETSHDKRNPRVSSSGDKLGDEMIDKAKDLLRQAGKGVAATIVAVPFMW